jgi:hypothetical protein
VLVAALAGCAEDGTFHPFRDGQLAPAQPDAHGTFDTRIWDMLDGSTRVTHHLVDWDARIETEVALPDGLVIERDAIVDVWGERDEHGVLEINALEVVEYPPQPLIDPEHRAPRRIATILVEWNGGGYSNQQATSEMFTGDASTNVFYGEASYGIETMSGDVFGPYEIANPGGCNTGVIQFYGMDALANHGHNADNYEQFMFLFPPTGGCGFSGLASTGSPDKPAGSSWYNGSFGCVVRNQELGHNYGMGHSHGQSCDDENGQSVPLSLDCEHIEYGDPFDPMGFGCGHMNAPQKTFMGWLSGCNVVNTTSSGTFNLMPFELPCDGPQALTFPSFATARSYWLEYRSAQGVFHGPPINLRGVVVHHLAEFEAPGSPSPYYVDLLQEGESFEDPDGVVTFTALELGDDYAVIDVDFAEPSGDAPTCRDGSDPGMEGGHVGMRACAAAPYAGDSEPPTITIVAPEDEAWFKPGSDFTIEAEVADDRAVIDVELYLDGEPQFRLTEPPWEWQVTAIPAGNYQFGAVARDSRHATPSNAVDIVVSAEPPMEDDTEGSTGPEPPTTGPATTTAEPPPDPGAETDDDGPGIVLDDDGCSCRSTSAPPPWLLLLLLPLIVRRRAFASPAAGVRAVRRRGADPGPRSSTHGLRRRARPPARGRPASAAAARPARSSARRSTATRAATGRRRAPR